ncbi:hypothetical protein P9112_005240 [Eukaryota sp. TZLM1-RC]
METPMKKVRVNDNDMFLQPKEVFNPVETPNAVGTPALSETPALLAYCPFTPFEAYSRTSVTLCYALFKGSHKFFHEDTLPIYYCPEITLIDLLLLLEPHYISNANSRNRKVSNTDSQLFSAKISQSQRNWNPE